MLRYLFILFCISLGISLAAQTIPEESVNWKLDTDGNQITLKYKLSGVKEKRPYLGVFVKARSEEGVKPIFKAKGDVGAGVDNDMSKEKAIRFDPVKNNLEDLGNLQFEFDVVSLPAKYAERGDVLLAPVRQLPYVGGIVLGAGMAAWALSLNSGAQSLYDTYTSELNPYSTVFNDLSREDHYLEANRKYRNAQILGVSGGALLITGAIFYIDFRIKRSAWKKMKNWSLGPTPEGIGMTIPFQH